MSQVLGYAEIISIKPILPSIWFSNSNHLILYIKIGFRITEPMKFKDEIFYLTYQINDFYGNRINCIFFRKKISNKILQYAYDKLKIKIGIIFPVSFPYKEQMDFMILDEDFMKKYYNI